MEEELDEALDVGSVGESDETQPVEEEASTEEVRRMEEPVAYRDVQAMDQKLDLTDHRDRMGADHMTWEAGRSHTPQGVCKLVREVWRLGIRLWREVEESTDVVGAAVDLGLDVDGVGDDGDGLWEG